MTPVYGYVRVSTQKQGKGVSLTEQRSAIVAYASRNDLDVIEWFEEKKTAAKTGRPAFTQMMRLLKGNNAKGVVFHKIDRSMRNRHDWAQLSDFNDNGIEVHFAGDSIDLNTRGGRLTADIQAVFATDYIYNLREETKKGFYGRLKQGLWPLKAPIGYVDTGRGKVKATDPVKAPLVRQAFKLYATGSYSLDTLSEKLLELGLTNRDGKKLSKNSLHKILRNPFYTGLMKVGTTKEVYQGKHTPLVSQKLFDDVQATLAGNGNPQKTKHDFLFKRHITCKHCGYGLYGETHKGFIYYRCHTKGCTTKCIKEEIISDTFDSILHSIVLPDKITALVQKRIEDKEQTDQSSRASQLKTIELQINNTQHTLDKLTDAYLEEMIDKAEYMKRKESYLKKINDYENQRDSLKKKPAISKNLELLGSLLASYKSASVEQKRQLLKILTSNRQVDGKNPLFTMKTPYWALINSHSVLQCDHHRDQARIICSHCQFKLKKINTVNIDQYINTLNTISLNEIRCR